MELKEIIEKCLISGKDRLIRQKSWDNDEACVRVSRGSLYLECRGRDDYAFHIWEPSIDNVLGDDWEFYEEEKETCEWCERAKRLEEQIDKTHVAGDYIPLEMAVIRLLEANCKCGGKDE